MCRDTLERAVALKEILSVDRRKQKFLSGAHYMHYGRYVFHRYSGLCGNLHLADLDGLEVTIIHDFCAKEGTARSTLYPCNDGSYEGYKAERDSGEVYNNPARLRLLDYIIERLTKEVENLNEF